MESIIIYPENKKQLNFLKTLLDELKVHFKTEKEVEELEDWQKELINRGLKDISEGKTVSHSDAQKKAREICLK